MYSRVCKLHLVALSTITVKRIAGESDNSVWCSKFVPYSYPIQARPASVLQMKIGLSTLTCLQLMIYTLLYALFKVIRRKTTGDWGFVQLEPDLVTLEDTLNYMRHKVRPYAKEYQGLFPALKKAWLDGFVLITEGVTREADEHGVAEEMELQSAHQCADLYDPRDE